MLVFGFVSNNISFFFFAENKPEKKECEEGLKRLRLWNKTEPSFSLKGDNVVHRRQLTIVSRRQWKGSIFSSTF